MKRLRRLVSEGSISMMRSLSESSLSASASSRGGGDAARFCWGRGRGLGRAAGRMGRAAGRMGRVDGEEMVEGRGAGEEPAWGRGEGEGVRWLGASWRKWR